MSWDCCLHAAALQNQDEPRAETMAKMVDQAKKLESKAAETIQAALVEEQGHLTNGHHAVKGQLLCDKRHVCCPSTCCTWLEGLTPKLM